MRQRFFNVGEVTVETKLDPSSIRARSASAISSSATSRFIIPNSVGRSSSDFDFTPSKGFILRVSAGVDVASGTATWALQAIDPLTGEVIRIPPRDFCRPTMRRATAGLRQLFHRAEGRAADRYATHGEARVQFNSAAPLDNQQLTFTLDSQAPTTTLTSRKLVTRGANYEVQWTAQDNAGGSGVKNRDGLCFAPTAGPIRSGCRQTTDTSSIFKASSGHTYRFLALATDNAGNSESVPAGVTVPNDGSSTSIGSLPVVAGTAQDLAPAPTPTTTPSTNAIFTQAEAGVPGVESTSHPAEFVKRSRRSRRRVSRLAYRRAMPSSARSPCWRYPTAACWSAAARRATRFIWFRPAAAPSAIH